jgi:hypothetical protein
LWSSHLHCALFAVQGASYTHVAGTLARVLSVPLRKGRH